MGLFKKRAERKSATSVPEDFYDHRKAYREQLNRECAGEKFIPSSTGTHWKPVSSGSAGVSIARRTTMPPPRDRDTSIKQWDCKCGETITLFKHTYANPRLNTKYSVQHGDVVLLQMTEDYLMKSDVSELIYDIKVMLGSLLLAGGLDEKCRGALGE